MAYIASYARPVNMWGTEADGSLEVAANTTLALDNTATSPTGELYKLNLKNLTINTSATLTLLLPNYGFYICVNGTLTLNGTIDMTGKGVNNVYPGYSWHIGFKKTSRKGIFKRLENFSKGSGEQFYENVVMLQPMNVWNGFSTNPAGPVFIGVCGAGGAGGGGAGGGHGTTYSGGGGGGGSGGSGGGGGGGGNYSYGGNGGNGGGGNNGGGGGGGSGGGGGGAGTGGSTTGGANGSNNNGGLLIIIARNIIGNGTLKSLGGSGGAGGYGNPGGSWGSGGGGGGGGGGGAIIVRAYNSTLTAGNVSNNGGNGGASGTGNGGMGPGSAGFAGNISIAVENW